MAGYVGLLDGVGMRAYYVICKSMNFWNQRTFSNSAFRDWPPSRVGQPTHEYAVRVSQFLHSARVCCMKTLLYKDVTKSSRFCDSLFPFFLLYTTDHLLRRKSCHWLQTIPQSTMAFYSCLKNTRGLINGSSYSPINSPGASGICGSAMPRNSGFHGEIKRSNDRSKSQGR